MQTKNVKPVFYGLTALMVLGFVGFFILGLKFHYFGNANLDYPPNQKGILGGYVIVLAAYGYFYISFLRKYDLILSKKHKDKY